MRNLRDWINPQKVDGTCTIDFTVRKSDARILGNTGNEPNLAQTRQEYARTHEDSKEQKQKKKKRKKKRRKKEGEKEERKKEKQTHTSSCA